MRTTKDNIKGVFPLTPMQEGLLHHALADSDQLPYMEQVCWTVRGILDCDLLEKSWNIVVARHDGLRTVFAHEGTDRPLQVVVKDAALKVEYQDLCLLDEQKRAAVKEEITQLQRKIPFNLSHDVLMRVLVIRQAEELYDVVWTHHHLLLDGWSVGIVLSELLKIYASLQDGHAVSLPAPVPVSGYLSWLGRQSGEASRVFWNQYLDGYTRLAEIPPSGRDLSAQAGEEGLVEFVLDSRLINSLSSNAAACGVTLTVVLQCIWGVILSRYNDCDDVVFGMVVCGRPAEVEGIESMVGNLINTVPVRIRLEAGMSWRSLATNVQEASLLATPHHYTSLAEIQRESGLPGGLFSTIMAMESYPIDPGAERAARSGSSGFVLEDTAVHERTNYALDVQFLPVPDGLRCTFFYDRDRHEDVQIQTLMDHFLRCAAACAESFDAAIDDVAIMSREELARVLLEIDGNTPSRLGQAVITLFEQQAAATPEAIALVYGGEALSYGELNRRANVVAWSLITGYQVGRGDVVAILLSRSVEYIVSILAIVKAGAAYLPLDPDIPEQRLAHMIHECRARYVILDNRTLIRLPFKHRLTDSFKPVVPQYSAPRAPIADLDTLPIIDRSLIDYEAYHQFLGQSTARFSAAIQATRGCPYRCAYCHKIWPKKHNRRSPEHIFAEVEKLYDCGVKRFVFIDDIFNLNRRECRSFFEKVVRKNMQCQFFFSNGLRGDILSHDDIDLMVAAGTIQMAFALETASPRLQQLIRKELKIDKLHDNLTYLATQYPQVILELFTMHGFPSETPAEAQLTLDFIQSIRWLHFPYVFILRIFPDTEMAEIASQHGISGQAIRESMELGYNELPTTLPFAREVATRHQMAFLNEYFIDKERLKQVLPYQMKVMDERSLVLKYDSYLPAAINTFDDLLHMAGLNREELGDAAFVSEEELRPSQLNSRFAEIFGASGGSRKGSGLRILLLDLSQYFVEDRTLLYDVVEPPLGLASLLTVLQERFAGRVTGKIAKARIDFADFDGLRRLLEDFRPDCIGVRTLTFYRSFFHKCIELVRQWGFAGPIIGGGPYATSSTDLLLSDLNVDLAVLGEGEETLCELVEIMLNRLGETPRTGLLPRDSLNDISGIAFIPEKQRQLLGDASCRLLNVERLSADPGGGGTQNPPCDLAPTDAAYIIYTSGSTGVPKGVVVEHRSITNLIGWLRRTVYGRYSSAIDEATVASLIFDVSVQQIFGALTSGYTLHLIPDDISATPWQLLDYLREHRVQLVNVTPSRLAMMLDAVEQTGRRITVDQLLVGAEKLSCDMLERFYRYPEHKDIALRNMYGPTECCVDAASWLFDESEFRKWKQLPIGEPVDNLYVRILDRSMRPVPPGIFGELYIGGEGVAREYVNRPEESARGFLNDPYRDGGRLYRTGDRVRWTTNGLLEFGGRIDNQLKVRGFRIEPEEIEKWLCRHPAVNSSAVALLESQEEGATLTAFVVTRDEVTVEVLLDYLRIYLPDYMIPTRFITVDRLPLNMSGKLDRGRLKGLISGSAMRRGSIREEARSTEEKVLATAWGAVLGYGQLSVHDNYFALGGDSIKAISVVSRMARAGWSLTIRDLFRHPTIAELAPYIQPVADSGGKPEAAADRAPVTAIQRLFFHNHLVEPDRFNHGMVLTSREPVDFAALQCAWTALVAAHGALRTSFRQDAEGAWQQAVGSGKVRAVELHTLTGSGECVLREKEIVDRLHGSLDIAAGELAAAACIRTDDGDRIFLVIHHLAVDGVSWRILLQDLAECYASAQKGRQPTPEAVPVSYIQWANTLQLQSSKPRFLAQLPYWQAVAGNDSSLPEGFSVSGANAYRDVSVLQCELAGEDTEKLCFAANRAYTTTVEDLLLCALGRALYHCYGLTNTLITLESHGREETFGLDLSRTCGWLTATFPFSLAIPVDRDLAYQIKSVKEAVRAVPDRGIGYGMLKFMTPQNLTKNYDLACTPAIGFNYLGRLEENSVAPFAVKLDAHDGAAVNPNDRRPHRIDIGCIVIDGALKISLIYSRHAMDEAAARAFADAFCSEIGIVIAQCCDGRGAELTPADLTYSALSLDELEGIL